MDRVFSFLLWPKREALGPWKQGRKKRESITCPTDWANEANKMFIIWLCWLFRFWNGVRELEVHTATYGPGIDQSQHAKSVSHIIKRIIDSKEIYRSHLATSWSWYSYCNHVSYNIQINFKFQEWPYNYIYIFFSLFLKLSRSVCWLDFHLFWIWWSCQNVLCRESFQSWHKYQLE